MQNKSITSKKKTTLLWFEMHKSSQYIIINIHKAEEHTLPVISLLTDPCPTLDFHIELWEMGACGLSLRPFPERAIQVRCPPGIYSNFSQLKHSKGQVGILHLSESSDLSIILLSTVSSMYEPLAWGTSCK